MFSQLDEKLKEDSSYASIIDAMQNYMINEKPFQDPMFSLVDIARKLNVSQGQLRYCFLELIKMKFTDYRTYHRIEYAKSMLVDGAADIYTLETIAKKAGFGSMTSFCASFKEATGLTPTDFLKDKTLRSGSR